MLVPPRLVNEPGRDWISSATARPGSILLLESDGADPSKITAAIAEALATRRASALIVASDNNEPQEDAALLADCRSFDLPIWLARPDPDGRALLTLYRPGLHPAGAKLGKRMLDVCGAAAMLLVLAPLMLLVALAIRLESNGPILFVQTRVGANLRPFGMLKFRSMRHDAADLFANRLTTRDDGRFTRLGRLIRRTSLDELPQLINVLRGEMSLVGPRPLPPGFHFNGRRFAQAIPNYRLRCRMAPGLTGLAQLHGLRGTPDTESEAMRMMRARVRMDNIYIERWSLLLDLRILVLTLVRGTWFNGAY